MSHTSIILLIIVLMSNISTISAQEIKTDSIVEIEKLGEVINDFNRIYNNVSYGLDYPFPPSNVIKERWYSSYDYTDGVFTILLIGFIIAFLVKNKIFFH